MACASTPFVLNTVDLNRSSSIPLYRQLYCALRQAILSGQLLPGMRLPATRTLAGRLDVSRNTVVEAFQQLIAEGYFEARVGSGTYVTQTLPDHLLRVRGNRRVGRPRSSAKDEGPDASQLSHRGQLLTDLQLSAFQDPERPRAFRPGIPALDAFPIETWGKLASRRWRSIPPTVLTYSQAKGYPPLREAIAAYLQRSRGVRCTAEQVIIVSGTQQAITLTAQVLLDPGDDVWMEDPGYPRAKGAFQWAGAALVPVPLDEQGFDLRAAQDRAPHARLAYVTPSHQYPLGMTMSLQRRLKLLEWAKQSKAWILEDDYDSEYRYVGRPTAALQGLDETGRVIYVGTFSKVLFPALRLAYLVAPPRLADAFASARTLVDRCPPLLQQMVVTDFIEGDHFERHLRQMRSLYAARQSTLIEATRATLGDQLRISSNEAGLHLVGLLDERLDDCAVSRALRKRNVIAPPLSFYASRTLAQGGLVLGYAAVDEASILKGVDHIKAAIKDVHLSAVTSIG